MKHYGDITKINGAEAPIVDVIVGGSPCQDLSIAGKRKGLNGERSGLFMEQIRIVKEQRSESVRQLRMRGAIEPIRPRFMVWENVVGAFSSNNGEDFRAVLEETAKIADENAAIPGPKNGKWMPSGCIMGNGWSIAWRVHDAQFWGVPQRRKRIALVADFGGQTAPEVLFERKGMQGDIEKSGGQGQEAAGGFRKSLDNTSEPIILESNQNHATIQTSGICTTLPASMGMGGGYVPMICKQDKHAYTMQAFGEYKECEKASSLKQRDYKDATDLVCYGLDRASFNQGKNAQYDFKIEEEKMATLVARGPGAVCTTLVRRLTPLECERLQGYPDNWTNIGEWIDKNGKIHKDTDTARYKALGNSIALPFWQWMARRMAAYLPQDATMASLFDGIGGFPLVYSRAGIKPIWASEIEEFPIAVTKIRFSEE